MSLAACLFFLCLLLLYKMSLVASETPNSYFPETAPRWPWSHCVAGGALGFLMHLPVLALWGVWCMLTCSVCRVLGLTHESSHMSSKHCVLHPWSLPWEFFKTSQQLCRCGLLLPWWQADGERRLHRQQVVRSLPIKSQKSSIGERCIINLFHSWTHSAQEMFCNPKLHEYIK